MATATRTRGKKAPASKRSAKPFTLLHFERWAETLVLDNDEPWTLEPFQREFLKDVFAGFRVLWWVIPEGNTKTTTLSGLALYHIEHRRNAKCSVAASSRDQAELLYQQADGFVLRSDRMGPSHAGVSTEPGVFKCMEGYRRIRHDSNHSRIQIFAADERTGDGAISSLFLIDELHRHRSLALYRTWMGKLKKLPNAQLIVISTAGEVGGEFEVERTKFRQHGEAKRRGSHTRVVLNNACMHEWALQKGESPDDFCAVKRANPFSGITIQDLQEKRELPGMTQSHWERLTCNRGSRPDNSAISEADWGAARTDEVIPEGEPIGAGLDVGWKWDTTALVPLWVPSSDYRLFGKAVILEPPRNGTSLDPEELQDAILDMNERNPLHTLVMDTSRAEDVAAWIARELPDCMVIDRSQQNSYAVEEYESFMKGLREGAIRHVGDPGLTRHVMNAIARELPGGDTRFDRPVQSRGVGAKNNVQEIRVIDALKAASMVHVTLAVERPDNSMPLVAYV